MASLKVKYLGSLELPSPIIIASSPLTSSLESITKLAQAGAGAIILKSIFEEQTAGMGGYIAELGASGAESQEYAAYYAKLSAIDGYTSLIGQAKAACQIPIIASINCTKGGNWVEYAKAIESAGADALQLNMFFMAFDPNKSATQVEDEYLEIVEQVAQAISIPISVKLPNQFTSLANFIHKLYVRGVQGVTLFNRFACTDINIDDMSVVHNRNIYSTAGEIRSHIQTLAMLSSVVKTIKYSASTGVHSPQDAIKMLLAGASTVEIYSTVHKNGVNIITQMCEQLDVYLNKHNIDCCQDLIGKLSYNGNQNDSEAYHRAQFMHYYSRK